MLVPLSKSEFPRIIGRVIDELERKHGAQLLYVAAKGSMARDTATAYSDVDLIAVLKSTKEEGYELLYRTTPIDVSLYTLDGVRKSILNVDGFWPHRVGSFLVNKVYVDRADVGKKIRRWHEAALENDQSFMEACEFVSFLEYLSKVLRARRSMNAEILRYAAWEIFFMSCMNIALLNKRFYYNHTTMIEQVSQFGFVPGGFLRSARNIFSRDLTLVAEAARDLVRINQKLARKFGFEKRPLTSLRQLRIP